MIPTESNPASSDGSEVNQEPRDGPQGDPKPGLRARTADGQTAPTEAFINALIPESAVLTLTPAAPERAQLAQAALNYFVTDTSRLPGGGSESCAAAVQVLLQQVFQHAFVRPGGDPNKVYDLRPGLLTGGWRWFDDQANALAGDIAIQNGQHPGTDDNPYENHIGVVVNWGEAGGALRVLSNSSSHKKFTYLDELDFGGIGYSDPRMMGPSRFYRYKP
jgi:hypothetical protein